MAYTSFNPLAVYPEDGEQTLFDIPDKYYSDSDIQVFRIIDGLETLVSPSDYTVETTFIEPTPPVRYSGRVRLNAAGPAGGKLAIFIWPPNDQDQRFEGVTVTPRQRERVHDRHAMRDAALRELFFRGYRSPLDAAPGLRFIAAGEPGRVPVWDAQGNLIEGPTVSEVSTVSAFITQVVTVAGMQNQVEALAALETEIVALYGDRAAIAGVYSIRNSVSTVAGVSGEVQAVAANEANINIVGSAIANVNAVGGNIAAVLAVEANEADISTVATDLTTTDTIGAVAGSIGNVNSVAAVAAEVGTVAGIAANVTTTAGIASDISTIAPISAQISALGAIDAELSALYNIRTDITTAAANIADIQAAPQAAVDAEFWAEQAQQWAESVDPAAQTPVGSIIYFPFTAAPTGWIKANGAEVSRTAYAALFAAIGTTFGDGDGSTTFNLPDLRGEFVRGWDDGRGIDSGRDLGSAQGDQNLSHSHTGEADSDGAHTHTGSTNTTGAHTHPNGYQYNAGSTAPAGGSGGQTNTGSAGNHSHTVTVNSGGAHTHTLSIDADGGNEARPRNVALLACIKY